MTTTDALQQGYTRFYERYFASGDGLYKNLATGQSPKTLVIACSDSRLDPAIITQAEPGDLFVVRNVANLVPPYDAESHGLHGVSAALEFAVTVLKVEHIIVLGHSQCGGIAALLAPETVVNTDFLSDWVSIAEPAKHVVLKQHSDPKSHSCQHACEQQSIINSLNNLMSFPWIKDGIEAGIVSVHGWYFSIQDGSMQTYDATQKAFVPLV